METNPETPLAPEPVPLARTRMYGLVNSLATTEQITVALNLKLPEELAEDFWADAFRTVRKRFLLLCLNNLGHDLATEWEHLTIQDLYLLANEAQRLLATPGFGYTNIRNWFIHRGQYEYSAAIQQRRERDDLAASCIRVLCLLQPRGAKYLAYDEISGAPVLVDGPVLAHKFPMRSPTQRESGHLLKMSEHFVKLKDIFPIQELKLLPGFRSKPQG